MVVFSYEAGTPSASRLGNLVGLCLRFRSAPLLHRHSRFASSSSAYGTGFSPHSADRLRQKPIHAEKNKRPQSRRPASTIHPGEGGGPARCTVKPLSLFFSLSTWNSWPEWSCAFSSVSVDWAHLWSPGLIAELMGDGTTLAGNLAFCGQRQDCRTVSSRFAGFSFSYQPPRQTAYPASRFHTCYLIPLSRTHHENGTLTAPQAVPSAACSRPFPSFSIPHAARAACCAHAQAESLLQRPPPRQSHPRRVAN